MRLSVGRLSSRLTALEYPSGCFAALPVLSRLCENDRMTLTYGVEPTEHSVSHRRKLVVIDMKGQRLEQALYGTAYQKENIIKACKCWHISCVHDTKSLILTLNWYMYIM